MTQKLQFRAVIKNAGGGGAYVEIPFDVEQVFGKKRVKVVALIEGQPYRGTLVRMGSSNHMLPVLKEIRQKIAKGFGDEISVELEEDLEPRQVELPADLQQALESDPAAREQFDKLSYTHRKEYVRWVLEAKRPETRQGRLRRTLEMLRQGKIVH